MAKSMNFDVQILANMIKVQDKMTTLIESEDTKAKVAKKEDSVNLLTYYIIRLFSLRKGLSTKSKKALEFFNDGEYLVLNDHLVSCYPMLSAAEIVRFASVLSGDDASIAVRTQYDICVKKANEEEK